MKNIHLIPTDKPSRLGRFIDTGKLSLRTDDDIPRGENINISITVDEEIKAGYYLDLADNSIVKVSEQELKLVKPYDKLQFKNIILTTDTILIADGVQPIDDTFLEWFVKNPSCEYVEVGYGWIRLTETDNEGYWVSIPDKQFEMQQEEPKQIKCYCGHTITCDCEPLQETLEEAAEDNAKKVGHYAGYQDFIKGAKWQKERMYSEEDMINFAHFYFKEEYNLAMMEINKSTKELLSEWFEQNKKKFG